MRKYDIWTNEGFRVAIHPSTFHDCRFRQNQIHLIEGKEETISNTDEFHSKIDYFLIDKIQCFIYVLCIIYTYPPLP